MLYADDVVNMSKLAEGLAKKMTVIQALGTSPLVIEAAGQMHRQTVRFLRLGGLDVTSGDIMPDIRRRIRLARACYNRFKREPYDTEDAPFTIRRVLRSL